MCASTWTRRGPRGLPSPRSWQDLHASGRHESGIRTVPLPVRGASIVQCGLSCLVGLNSYLGRLCGSHHVLYTFWARRLSWINKRQQQQQQQQQYKLTGCRRKSAHRRSSPIVHLVTALLVPGLTLITVKNQKQIRGESDQGDGSWKAKKEREKIFEVHIK